jgi:hypothetical protein
LQVNLKYDLLRAQDRNELPDWHAVGINGCGQRRYILPAMIESPVAISEHL